MFEEATPNISSPQPPTPIVMHLSSKATIVAYCITIFVIKVTIIAW
jgi:hypothetical protein